MDNQIGKRIIALRKFLNDINQGEFSKKLGIKQAVISNVELGKNGPSNSTLRLICLIFGVNEEWLLTGNGEMFDKKSDFENSLSLETKEMLKLYDRLLPDTQKVIREYIYEMYELQELRKQALKAQSQPSITVSNPAAEPEAAAAGYTG